MRICGVRADDDDDAGVCHGGEVLRAGGGAERVAESEAGRRVTDARARVDVVGGNTLIGTFDHRRGPISYADLIRMKMAYAAKV